MGFLTPDAPAPIKKVPSPPSAPTRAEPSIALAGLRVAQRENTGTVSQRAATSFKSGGLLGGEKGGRRKRTLIGGAS